MGCCVKFSAYLRCRCPQDGIVLNGSFSNSAGGGILGFLGGGMTPGAKVAYFSTNDKPSAQLAIATAMNNAGKRH
ncbi:unnamed protein product [Rotaria sp. Silwood2]|nr:unnamed protein product [Rotaria sp. Silwood2]CAF2550749.1 unnamed protein product [Rotaria sp. Silwood2]CAF3097877.1 unnamed protein product [Rotaria sp. Silwood2]CAF3241021.1 unnamed protein product [Rotaria sp. Silwood2]CAF3944452.1 unnamed protein product [Rotaria sp. Silwood2]